MTSRGGQAAAAVVGSVTGKQVNGEVKGLDACTGEWRANLRKAPFAPPPKGPRGEAHFGKC